TPENRQNDIAAIGQGVHEQFDKILVPNGLGHISIYTELGRYMLAPHGHLITKVLHRKETYRTYIGLDACAV
ncbi:diaminopimelate decarboxylase, partial [Streptococcus suis]